MKNSTQYKVGQFYRYRNEATSKIVEIRGDKYTFIVLENGNIVSVCK
jgi:hypothetical protein